LRLATYWERCGALLIDLVAVAAFLGMGLIGTAKSNSENDVGGANLIFFGTLVVALAYWVVGNAIGQTIGGAVVGVRTVRESNDARPGAYRGVVRWLVTLVTLPLGFIGYFWMLRDAQRRTWHDIAAGTVVIRAAPREATMKECPTCKAVTDANCFCGRCREFLRAPGLERRAADWWQRIAALLLDYLLFCLLLGIGWLVWFFFSATEGQTPGKKLLGLRVIRADGTVAPPATMWRREVLIKPFWPIAGYFGLIPYLWAFLDKDRQTLHDKMMGTYVVHYPGPASSLTPLPVMPMV
jgi:uncharacterized RDD family membrane protein YckC